MQMSAPDRVGYSNNSPQGQEQGLPLRDMKMCPTDVFSCRPRGQEHAYEPLGEDGHIAILLPASSRISPNGPVTIGDVIETDRKVLTVTLQDARILGAFLDDIRARYPENDG